MTIRTLRYLVLGAAAFAGAMAQTAAAQTAVHVEDGALVLPSPVQFEAGSDTLAAGSEEGLAEVVQWLADKTYITLLRVETNAAVLDQGDDNLALGKARARRLAEWFAGHGADCKRLIYVTFGDSKPVAAAKDPANERIEFRPATLRGIPIGGMPVDGNGLVVQSPCT